MGVDPTSFGIRHVPVLAHEAVGWLVWRNDGVYVDATLGEGGHAELVCQQLTGGGRLLGIDRDPAAHRVARNRLRAYQGRVHLFEAPFSKLGSLLDEAGLQAVSGVLFDLGVSSAQLDVPERGFSYQSSGPLDMRMGPDTRLTAGEIVNSWTGDELVRLFREFGEEPFARPIARAIVRARSHRAIRTTDELAEIIGRWGRARREKTLARVFQALRIAVNRELEELESGLATALRYLEPGGRVVVIAYHSLEDRLVKEWVRREARDCICPPGIPVCRCGHRATMRPLTRRVVRPSSDETARNPRARSARMRVAERLSGEREEP